MNINLPLVLQKYDKGNQWIYIREFTEELRSRNINLRRDDLNFLLSKVKPNNMNQINYVEMSNFIMNNPMNNTMMNNMNNPMNNPMNSPTISTVYNQSHPGAGTSYNNNNNLGLFQTILEKIKTLYQSQGISLKAFFRQLDLDNDNYISFKEFKDCLERKLQIYNINDNQVEECFKQFDDDRDYKISYFEFSKHILNTSGIDHKKLLQKLKKQLLEKTEEEKDLLKLFKSMDQDGNGFLSFKELNDALQNYKINFSRNEIEELFKYFDKEEKEKISYDYFVEVLSEDHLNLTPLRNKVQEILRERGLTLKAYFRSLNSKGEDEFLNKKEFSDFLKKMGFKYDSEQEEDIFEAFDQDKDYLISYDEFNNVINGKIKGDKNNLMRKLRRFVFSNKIDLLGEFQNLDRRGEGYLSFFQFNKALKKFSELSPNEIETIFKSFAEADKIDYQTFWDELLENDIDIQPIKIKFDELCKRWNVDYDGLFDQFDQSAKGYLTWMDFDQMMLALQIRLPLEELQEYFNAFDVNKNGNLTKNEFLQVLRGKQHQNRKMIHDLKAPAWRNSSRNLNQQFVFQSKGGIKEKNKGLGLKPIDFDDEEDNYRDSYKDNKRSRNLEFKQEKIEEFKPMQLLETLKNESYRNRIDLFNYFTEYDVKKTCVLTNVKDLDTVIRFRLGLRQIPEKHIQDLFNYYSPDGGKTMNFIRLLMDFEDPSLVLIKMMTYVMRIQKIQLFDVFSNVDKDDDQMWDFQEFSSLNKILNIGMDQTEIENVFKQWDLNRNGYITIRELEKIFNLNTSTNYSNNNNAPQKKPIYEDSNYNKNQHQGANKSQNYQRKYQKIQNYLRYILQNLQEKNIRSLQNLFETGEDAITRNKFLKDLSKIRINVEKPEANELCSLLSLENQPNFINLLEFEYLMKNFAEIFNEKDMKNSFIPTQSNIEKPLNSNLNAILQELKSLVEEEGFQMFTQYDRNATGYITDKDLYLAFTKIIDPCDELEMFVKHVSQNGRVSLDELKKIFNLNEKSAGFGNIDANSMGVKTNYQKAKVLNNNEKKLLMDGMKELWNTFSRLYTG